MKSVELMQRAENQEFGRLNRMQEEGDVWAERQAVIDDEIKDLIEEMKGYMSLPEWCIKNMIAKSLITPK